MATGVLGDCVGVCRCMLSAICLRRERQPGGTGFLVNSANYKEQVRSDGTEDEWCKWGWDVLGAFNTRACVLEGSGVSGLVNDDSRLQIRMATSNRERTELGYAEMA